MEKIRKEITALLEKLKAEIQANMESEGVNASGRTSKSLRVVNYKDGVMLVASAGDRAPMRTLEKGREGGEVPRGFYYIIKQWTRDKGLTFSSERERGTFAYFLSRKIAREGTDRHKNNINVYTNEVDKARAEAAAIIKVNFKNLIGLNQYINYER